MKKIYIAPQTEAIKLLSENAIMAVSPGGGGFTDPGLGYGGESGSGFGGN